LGAAFLSSLSFDLVARRRLGGLNMSEFMMVETPLPLWSSGSFSRFLHLSLRLSLGSRIFAQEWIDLGHTIGLNKDSWISLWALNPARRLQMKAAFDAAVAVFLGLNEEDLRFALTDCDYAAGISGDKFDPKGFWRVDKDKDPELRQTVLTLIAFYDLEEKIRASGGDREKGVEAFLNQNDGEGWMLPETLRLADYGLGHDERANQSQPVAPRLGPRFYDWQLTQSSEESWHECHLHARNLLGETGYRQLLDNIESPEGGEKAPLVSEPSETYNNSKIKQGELF